jgi:hypothetical protein
LALFDIGFPSLTEVGRYGGTFEWSVVPRGTREWHTLLEEKQISCERFASGLGMGQVPPVAVAVLAKQFLAKK